MHLNTLSIENYKCFSAPFTISFNQGLTVLAGENGSGKSAVIDAIRLALHEDEFGNRFVSSSDFHRPLTAPAKSRGADSLSVRLCFDGLAEQEQIAYLPWLAQNDATKALLTMSVENKEDARGKFKRKVWGGESSSSAFEWDLLSAIACIYLPPLRDAEDKLRAYRGSRLARLMRSLRIKDEGTETHPLEKAFEKFNRLLLRDETIDKANKAIRKYAQAGAGPLFGQDTQVQFSEASFDRIVERLRLLYYPILPGTDKRNPAEFFRELDQNSLGFNNVLYIAAVLAEFEGLEHQTVKHKMLLVEEPEAHLHPQLQIQLLTFLEKVSKEDNIQVIVTTHSPTIAASVSLNTMVVFSRPQLTANPQCVSLSRCGLSPSDTFFLERWLDITKCTLLFAKAVILVEGIAEALLMPELAKTVIAEYNSEHPQSPKPATLEENGITIVNMGGIFFDHFMQLFKGYFLNEDGQPIICECIPIRCSGLTDCDPDAGSKPYPGNTCESNNPQIALVAELQQHSAQCRLFSNFKTFEYDLALEVNNLVIMANAYIAMLTTDGSNRNTAQEYAGINWVESAIEAKADAAFWLLEHISHSSIGKGRYAQVLTEKVSKEQAPSLFVPDYIRNAVHWAIGV